jgi:hypothetical protein
VVPGRWGKMGRWGQIYLHPISTEQPGGLSSGGDIGCK